MSKRLLEFVEADNGNILPLLAEGEANKIGRLAVQEYQSDCSDEQYSRKTHCWQEGQEVVQMLGREKNFPFENAANVTYPLLTTAAIQFSARAYPGIVQGNSVVKPKIIGAAMPYDPREDELAQFAQQLQMLPPEQQQQAQMELSQMAQSIEADKKDKIARAERVCEFVNWQLFNEIEEWEEETDRLLLMLPLYGSMFRCTYYSEEKRRICSELLSPEELVVPSSTKSLSTATRISKVFTLTPREVVERQRSGKYIEDDIRFEDEEAEKPEEFLEQIRYMDLDEDGYKEPYVVTVHLSTGKTLRIQPNYTIESIFATEDGKVLRIEPVRYYTKYTFIPSTDGCFYDQGFFDLLLPVNKVVNTAINQMLDAATLANAGGGFISNDVGIRKKGQIRFSPGEFKSIGASGDDIRRGIYQMQFPGPSPAMFNLLGMMMDAGRDIANLKEVLEGQVDNNMTATTTMALIEQGLQVFSAIYKRIHRSLGEELKIIRWWNNVIRNPLYQEVIDQRMKAEDFADDDLDFIPVSDPSIVTDMQKMARVQFLMQFLNDPYFDQVKLRIQIGEGASIDGFEELLGPNPELQQRDQQIQQLTQMIQQMGEALNDKRIQDRLEAITARADLDLKESEAVKNETISIKNIADAEAVEAGPQLEAYKAFLGELSEGRRMGGMGRESGDADVQDATGNEVRPVQEPQA